MNEPQLSAPVSASFASCGLAKLIPSFFASATAAAGPTCSSRCTKYVFTDRPNASHMVRLPSIHEGLELPGQYLPPQLSAREKHRLEHRQSAVSPQGAGG